MWERPPSAARQARLDLLAPGPHINYIMYVLTSARGIFPSLNTPLIRAAYCQRYFFCTNPKICC